jgi:proteasome lid subunit RPN8/RPN11
VKTLERLAAILLAGAAACSPPKRSHDVRTGLQQLRDQFIKLGIESTLDNFEYGGIVVEDNYGLRAHVIPNDLEHDNVRYHALLAGDLSQLGMLSNHVSAAAMSMGACAPESAMAYTAQGLYLHCMLAILPWLPPQHRDVLGQAVWEQYDMFVRRRMYLRDEHKFQQLKKRYEGKIIAHFHTHPSGGLPSGQDLSLTKGTGRIELVIAYDGSEYRLYKAENGMHELIDAVPVPRIGMR